MRVATGPGVLDMKSGIVFFPGSAPLYRGGQMVGGLGVSGDGVEQDDFVTFGGASRGPSTGPAPLQPGGDVAR